MSQILIIGASGEIGQAIVRELSQFSHQFILHYHQNNKAINELASDLNEDQLLMTIRADLTEPKDIDSLMMSIPFSIDIIIFAQGQAHYGMFKETTASQIDDLYQTHVKSTMLITKHFLPQMIRKQSGNIIVVTSIWGEVGASYEVAYSTMKGAQISFVKALAKEVGNSGIKVNAVSPGLINTKMNLEIEASELDKFEKTIPLQRKGKVKDVANTVKFLCSKDSSYIHGQIIKINGGML
ncbi:SDR family oxidoreductase [Filobacillus milosensis]|uniref:SDR family oxidoreductase n=1 Tax=Filobacillus milosensis TaxID=94137 RepID=A0A4Y8IR46_9BACI|nr:SDR family oxidoreductase [Filobacillus milosensis]TFB23148.1 SDR family oxidoreductase [Filobacillus milosensis]